MEEKKIIWHKGVESAFNKIYRLCPRLSFRVMSIFSTTSAVKPSEPLIVEVGCPLPPTLATTTPVWKLHFKIGFLQRCFLSTIYRRGLVSKWEINLEEIFFQE